MNCSVAQPGECYSLLRGQRPESGEVCWKGAEDTGPSWGAQDLVEGGPPPAGVPVPALDGVLDTFYVYLYLRLGWCTCTHVHWLMCREGSCRKLDSQSMVNVLIMINPLVAPVVGTFIDVSRRAEFASLLRLGYVSPGALQ